MVDFPGRETLMPLVLGALLALAGLVLFRWAAAQGATADLIAETPTSSVCAITDFGRYEVSGTVECDRPLQCPGTGEPCVWFRVRVRQRTKVHARGAYHGRGRSAEEWQTVRDEQSDVPFRVRDETGSFTVFPSGADVRPSKVLDDHSAADIRERIMSGLGTVTGQHVDVDAVLVGAPVYVLGEVQPSGEGNAFMKGEGPFVISTASEEELLQSTGTSALAGQVAGALMLVGGVAWAVLWVAGR